MLLSKLLVFLFLFFSSCSHFKKDFHSSLFKNNLNEIKRTKESYEAYSEKAMIVSEGDDATAIALNVLKSGGTALDAAIALSFAISVLRPHSTGIGGGGFLLYYHKKENKVYVLDMREVAPERTHSTFYMKNGKVDSTLSREGGKAVAVPGLVAGLWEAYEKLSPKKIKWKDLVAPSAELAESGFLVYPALERAIRWAEKNDFYKKFPDWAKLFSDEKTKKPLQVGDWYKNENLAQTLRKIAAHGKDGFYSGGVAKDLVESTQEAGGVLLLTDLNRYEPKWREPVEGTYKGYRVVSMPPPSSGGVHILQILKMLENIQMPAFGSAQSIHLKAEAMRRAYADRSEYLGDPDYVRIPLQELLSKDYNYNRAASVDPNRATPSQKEVQPGGAFEFDRTETTHFSIVDSFGNAVVSTQTINTLFGSGVVGKNSGVILNNEMDDFAIAPGVPNAFGLVGGVANQINPGKRPLSSMSPTFVFEGNQLLMGLGSPGGAQIITSVFNVIFNVLEHKMDLQNAVFSPRIHHQWLPDRIILEKNAVSQKTLEELRRLGHEVEMNDDRLIGNISAFFWDKENKKWVGVADYRREGRAAGL